MNSLIRQVLLVTKRRRVLSAGQRRKKKTSFSTRQGLMLVFGIAAFVGLIFILVYYVWYLPIEKSMQ